MSICTLRQYVPNHASMHIEWHALWVRHYWEDHGKGWPPKNGGYVKSHKWHTWNICIKVVKGLYEPYQSLSSAFMNNRMLESIAKHKTGKSHKGANCLPYCGKLSREKTFTNFAVLCLFMDIFLQNLGVRCSLVRHKWVIRECFLHKIVFFTNSRKFSPSEVSRIRYLLTFFLLPSMITAEVCIVWKMAQDVEMLWKYCSVILLGSQGT